MSGDVVHHRAVRRHARVLVAGDPETASEAWLVLHGYGMLARGILHWFRPALRPGRLLVAPEATSRFYVELSGGRRAVGASWNTREEIECELDDNREYLDAVVAEFVPPAATLQVHGFSQGVSVAARWSVRTARKVDRLVCWAGGFPEDVTADLIQRSHVSQPIHLVVGTDDTRVLPEQVEADAARLRAEGVAVALRRFDGGHRVSGAGSW